MMKKLLVLCAVVGICSIACAGEDIFTENGYRVETYDRIGFVGKSTSPAVSADNRCSIYYDQDDDKLYYSASTGAWTAFATGSGILADGDYGDITVGGTGTTMAVDADTIALTTDTSGNYVAAVADGTGIDGTASAEGATYTPTFDATELSGLTWGPGTGATIGWTWNIDTTDPSITFGNDTVTVNNTLAVATGKNITLGLTTLNSGDALNGASIAAADYGDVTIAAGSWAVEDDSHAHTTTTISGVDISADTNLTAGDNLTLTDDDLDLDSTATLDEEWNTEAEVQTVWGSVNILLETEIDASSELDALMDDDTGSGSLVFSYNPLLALVRIGNADTSAGMLQINEDTDDGTNNATITVPALAADTDYILPPAYVAGGALTDVAGDGTLTWVVPAGDLSPTDIDTSSEVGAILTDEVGNASTTGKLVFNDNPTFVTGITTPLVTVSGAGLSLITEGLVVNDSGGATANDVLRVESNTEEYMLYVMASADAMYLGGYANFIKVDKGGAMSVGGTGTIAAPFDDLADPGANGSISFAGYEQTLTSSTDGWGGFTIESTVADNASATTLLTLQSYDATDADMVMMKIIRDADGTPATAAYWTGGQNNYGDQYTLTWGDSSDVYMMWDANDADDNMKLGVNCGTDGTASGNIIICEDDDSWSEDWGHDFNADPHLFIHSSTDADATGTDNSHNFWGCLYHDGVAADTGEFHIDSGFGGIAMNGTLVSIGNGATTAGILAIQEDTSDGTNNATFTVPALAADTDYTLPPDDGEAGEQLQTNGAGVLTWEAAATDVILMNKWRVLESEKYAGYPVGVAIAYSGFEGNIVTDTMPDDCKPVFVVTDEFIEFQGVRLTAGELMKLKEFLKE